MRRMLRVTRVPRRIRRVMPDIICRLQRVILARLREMARFCRPRQLQAVRAHRNVPVISRVETPVQTGLVSVPDVLHPLGRARVVRAIRPVGTHHRVYVIVIRCVRQSVIRLIQPAAANLVQLQTVRGRVLIRTSAAVIIPTLLVHLLARPVPGAAHTAHVLARALVMLHRVIPGIPRTRHQMPPRVTAQHRVHR